MRKAFLATGVVVIFILSGCMAAAIPLAAGGMAVGGWGLFKSVQTMTGGSFQIAFNETKISEEQKKRLATLRHVAVWPDPTGNGAVVFTETLGEGNIFQTVSPSRVIDVLKRHNISDRLEKYTSKERNLVFARICQDTSADAVIYSVSSKASANMNMFSFDRANQQIDFVVYVYGKNIEDTIIELPVVVKVEVGGKISSANDIAEATNKEVANKIIEMAAPYALLKTSNTSNNELLTKQAAGSNNKHMPVIHDAKVVTKAQNKLIQNGYNPGPPDGILGKNTIRAIEKYQKDVGLKVTGRLDSETTARLFMH